eukprot:763008-Hanusia_phi.AAC.2
MSSRWGKEEGGVKIRMRMGMGMGMRMRMMMGMISDRCCCDVDDADADDHEKRSREKVRSCKEEEADGGGEATRSGHGAHNEQRGGGKGGDRNDAGTESLSLAQAVPVVLARLFEDVTQDTSRK